jgi:hypothetical protein
MAQNNFTTRIVLSVEHLVLDGFGFGQTDLVSSDFRMVLPSEKQT